MTTTTEDVCGNRETDAELNAYKTLLRELNEARATFPFSNSQPAHAAAIFEEFFRTALDRVVIFCRNLNPEVFEDSCLLKELKEALCRGVQVDVICQEPPMSRSVTGMTEAHKDCLSIRMAGKESQRKLKENFAVMDGRAIRLEMDHDHAKAFACFNARKRAKALEDAFDAYLENATPLPAGA